ncbi:hypothetical protein AB0O28_32585 [Microbispora sp. NPDC088329]|uniref:hypothetical protein n=1 Tax=Microbispora sp. NPDC088329 TaxID=3154869 RepID=UPI00341C50E8
MNDDLVDAHTGERVDGPGYVFAAGPAAGPIMRQRYEGVAHRPAPASADASPTAVP